MNRRAKILLTILLLACFTVIGLTYAYFTSQLRNNAADETVEVGSGLLRLHYFDGNGEIVVDKMIPGNVVETKTFSVKNTGKNDIPDYDVYLDTVTNQLEHYEDLTYVLTCKEYDTNDNFIKDCNGVTNSVFPQSEQKLVTNSILVGYVHKYELSITYLETYTDQSNDMGKVVKGRIGIYDDTEATGK